MLGDKSFKGYEYDNSEKIALEPWQTREILPVPAESETLSMPRDLLITHYHVELSCLRAVLWFCWSSISDDLEQCVILDITSSFS